MRLEYPWVAMREETIRGHFETLLIGLMVSLLPLGKKWWAKVELLCRPLHHLPVPLALQP